MVAGIWLVSERVRPGAANIVGVISIVVIATLWFRIPICGAHARSPRRPMHRP
jgi:hypothetical protein